MMTNMLAGPLGHADWEEKRLGGSAGAAAGGQLHTLLLLPDASNGKRAGVQVKTYYYLPGAPLLRRDADGNPALSLTLLLSRKPNPDEATIYPLITQGILTVGLTLDIGPHALTSLNSPPDKEYRPIFSREVTFELLKGKATLFSTGVLANSAEGALVANLDPAGALAVLSAMKGEESDLSLCALVSYRAAADNQTVTLRGSWARIHDFLSATRKASDAPFTRAEIRTQFEKMVASGEIVIEVASPTLLASAAHDAQPADMGAVFEMFMDLTSIILTCQTPELPPSDDANQYLLVKRPHEMFHLDYQQALSISSMRSKRIIGKLASVLGGVLASGDADKFIRIVSTGEESNEGDISTGGAGLSQVPRRVVVRGGKPLAMRLPGEGGNRLVASQVALVDNSIMAISRALRPDNKRGSQALHLLRSDLVEAVVAHERPIMQWVVDDLQVFDPIRGSRSLPTVDDPAAPLWVDRLDGGKFWYAPQVSLRQPSPADDPATSSFLFTFERAGATVTGEPGLDGSVRFMLQITPSPDTQAAIEARGRPQANPVPMRDISIWLQLPFRDESGSTRMQSFSATFEQQGDTIIATVRLLNDWVRLCYGALSRPGFQSEPSRLSVAYSYDAYVPLARGEIILASGKKSAIVPVVYSKSNAKDGVDWPHFDAAEAAYRLPGVEVRLKREASTPDMGAIMPRLPIRDPEGGGDPGDVVEVRPPDGIVVKPEVITPVVEPADPPPAHPIIVTPPFVPRPLPIHVFRPPKYAQRTLLRQEAYNLSYPCDTLGALYREMSGGVSTAIGCRDAFQLGQTSYRQYEEVAELASPHCRVFRSLQQPGRFLVLPARYRISRYEPSAEGKAYRPTMLVYSVLDANNPTSNRVAFAMGLEPDLPLYARRDLLDKLSAYARNPIIDYPTYIESEVEYAWAVHVEALAIKTPEGLHVTLTTDWPGALLLRTMLQTSGVFGSVSFKLPDGSRLESAIALELNNITGPWSSGPLEVFMTEGQANLLNRTESTLRVSDLILYTASGPGKWVPVEATLLPGASHTVALPEPATEIYPVYSFPPGGQVRLEEIRSFMEDIHTNVIFVDLINYGDYGLSRLELQARVEGLDHTYGVPMTGNPPVGEIKVALPITMFLEKRIVQFQVTKIFTSGEVAVTPWLSWDMQKYGNVVSVTWKLIEQSEARTASKAEDTTPKESNIQYERRGKMSDNLVHGDDTPDIGSHTEHRSLDAGGPVGPPNGGIGGLNPLKTPKGPGGEERGGGSSDGGENGGLDGSRSNYYYVKGRKVPLVKEGNMMAVRFLPGNGPLSEEANDILDRRVAPVSFLAEHGIHVYRSAMGERATRVLDSDVAVEFATPVYRRTPENQEPMFITRNFLVQFKPEVTRPQIEELNATYGVKIVGELEYAPNGYMLEAPTGAGQTGAVTLANTYFETGLTLWAHPDFIKGRQTKRAPGQPTLSERTNGSSTVIVERTAEPAFLSQQWHLATAKVLDAWIVTKGDPGINVAILDDGLDTTHVEFRDKLGEMFDFSRNVEDVTPQREDDNHGTACAGVAVAAGKKASGVAPNCTLMAARTPRYLGSSDEASMFVWAADNGADVISCSWGPRDGTGDFDPLPDNVAAAIHECVRAGGRGRGGKGIPIFWAAGNGSESVSLDGYASNPDVMAIAASTSSEMKATYSDFGKEIWVCAPSNGDLFDGDKEIFTVDRTGDAGYNTGDAGKGDVNGDYTNNFGGTSSATPLVAGVAALMLSVNPDLTVWQVREILKRTADKIGDKNSYNSAGFSHIFGYGRVNALKAVKAAANPPTHTLEPDSPTSDRPTITGPQSVSRSEGPPSFSVTLPGGEFYAVEVATDPELLVVGEGNGFYGSWSDTDLLSEPKYTLPASVWERLKGADRLYYRMWTSTSATDWENAEATILNEAIGSAPYVQISDSTLMPHWAIVHKDSADGPDAGGVVGSMVSMSNNRLTLPPNLTAGAILRAAGSFTTDALVATTLPEPKIDGPRVYDVGNDAPTFRVLPGENRYYAVEVATDAALFDYDGHGGEREEFANFYGSWQEGLREAKGPTTYTLPHAAWRRLREANRLYYRVVTSAENNIEWPNYQTSTPDGSVEDAPYIELTGPSSLDDLYSTRADLWRRSPI
jgi:subtilisin family serine protease